MALIFQRAAAGGWRAAVPTVLGLEAGLYVWALAAAAGFAALVAVSTTAFVALKVVGAAVLPLETAFYLTLAYGVGRAGAFFRRSKVRRRRDAITGTVLVALGVRRELR